MASSQGETAFRRVPAPTAVRFDRDRNERNDNGNSHALMLDVYLRMLSEYRRIGDSRQLGTGRDY